MIQKGIVYLKHLMVESFMNCVIALKICTRHILTLNPMPPPHMKFLLFSQKLTGIIFIFISYTDWYIRINGIVEVILLYFYSNKPSEISTQDRCAYPNCPRRIFFLCRTWVFPQSSSAIWYKINDILKMLHMRTHVITLFLVLIVQATR